MNAESFLDAIKLIIKETDSWNQFLIAPNLNMFDVILIVIQYFLPP